MLESASGVGPRRKPRRLAPPKPLTLTIDDTSKITRLGRTTIYSLIKQNKLKAVAIGRRRLVLYASIEALLEPSTSACPAESSDDAEEQVPGALLLDLDWWIGIHPFHRVRPHLPPVTVGTGRSSWGRPVVVSFHI
jgi:excisionase family DNA binding protein